MLHSKRLALAGGITWGAVMLLLTILCMNNGFGGEFLDTLASIYPGYTVSGPGCIVGLIYGFISGAAILYAISRLYNKLPNPKVGLKD